MDTEASQLLFKFELKYLPEEHVLGFRVLEMDEKFRGKNPIATDPETGLKLASSRVPQLGHNAVWVRGSERLRDDHEAFLEIRVRRELGMTYEEYACLVLRLFSEVGVVRGQLVEGEDWCTFSVWSRVQQEQEETYQ